MTTAIVKLWKKNIGAVSWLDESGYAAFEYEPDFVASGISVSPIMMPLKSQIYQFPALAKNSFNGLPGLVADSLPDKFGTAVIDAWLASQGRPAGSMNPVERLCYTGRRGMGALEFVPSHGPRQEKISRDLNIDALISLSKRILEERSQFKVNLKHKEEANALKEILRVGTSAGGMRPKAVIAWNPNTKQIRSGQVEAGDGFEYWLLKFDGVARGGDQLATPQGYGLVEYAYHLLAVKAGIAMSKCELLKETNRSHFMTKRFDREDNGDKIHMQSFAALAHLDYDLTSVHSYEQCFRTITTLGLPRMDLIEQYKRMVFNVIGCNHDDHVKNIAFLMNKQGNWSLAPAFDLSFATGGQFMQKHQMSVNLKNDRITREDLIECGKKATLKKKECEEIIDEVLTVFTGWKVTAESVGVLEGRINQIDEELRRLRIPITKF